MLWNVRSWWLEDCQVVRVIWYELDTHCYFQWNLKPECKVAFPIIAPLYSHQFCTICAGFFENITGSTIQILFIFGDKAQNNQIEQQKKTECNLFNFPIYSQKTNCTNLCEYRGEMIGHAKVNFITSAGLFRGRQTLSWRYAKKMQLKNKVVLRFRYIEVGKAKNETVPLSCCKPPRCVYSEWSCLPGIIYFRQHWPARAEVWERYFGALKCALHSPL